MSKAVPYLFFSGNCKEAMEFYKECLGGDLDIQIVGNSPAKEHMPEESHNSVMHSALTKGKFELYASDMMDGERVVGNALEIAIVCDSKEEINDMFSKLSEGGEVSQPLVEEYFGTFGKLKDKFGIEWMFQFGMGQN